VYTKIGVVEKAVPAAVVQSPTVPKDSTTTAVVPARSALRRLTDEAGAATAEYVVATMAAVGFAGLLIVILRSDEVRGMLTDLVSRALSIG
jgi:hypothetical protein